ncbi:MAG: Mg2+ and Co2+ transporter [Gammaproteobacteria bacterium]|jgi:magnesium and cobalt transporter|nr:Mg2+ and Co2+ transporter [Gammaproteobacteria bacterium]
MNNEEDQSNKSWLEKLGHAIFRPKNRKELLAWLEDIAKEDLIDHAALAMIKGVIEVYDMQVRDIMVPRSQMIVLSAGAPLKDILPIVISSAHSRFPVIKENKDEIIGVLLAKDLLKYAFSQEKDFDIKNIIRPVIFIPESKRLNILLEEFQLNRNHMAVVLDEYGAASGVLTIEDVLEEIVGDIEDEYDVGETEKNIYKISQKQFTLKALTPIEDFNVFFGTHLDEETFDTIGGLVTQQFEHLPKRGESIVIDKMIFKVLQADKRRIRSLQLTLPEKLEKK